MAAFTKGDAVIYRGEPAEVVRGPIIGHQGSLYDIKTSQGITFPAVPERDLSPAPMNPTQALDVEGGLDIEGGLK